MLTEVGSGYYDGGSVDGAALFAGETFLDQGDTQ